MPAGPFRDSAELVGYLRIELGGIWYLLLDHAFRLGYRRVEWKCDALNQRSRRAAERLGFNFEGVQEAHYIVKGRNRDTASFRILANEWRAVDERLRGLLEAR